MGLLSRAAGRIAAAFAKRPAGAVRSISTAMPLATRTWRELTPDDALAALEQGQRGAIRRACDFCDALLTDDRIAGVLDTRTLGMLGLPLYFEGAELPEWWTLAPESECARILLWGLLLGAGFAHIEADGSLRWWHSRNFDFDPWTREWYVTTSEGREKISRTSGEWLIYEPYGAIESVLAGLWVSLALPVLVKLYSLHDRARASEVFGSAMVVGKAPEGSTEPQRKTWLRDLKALARDTRTVLPEGFDLTLLEAQGQTWGIYQQSIEWADNAITIRIAGQLVTTTGTGSFSRGDVHEKIARSLLRFGEQTFSTCLAKQYIPFVWALPSVARWLTISPDDVIGEGAALKAFADGASALAPLLASTPVELDVEAYMRKYGIATRPRQTAAPVALSRIAASAPATRNALRRETCRSAIPQDPPTEFRIFKMGANVTDYGTRYYTAESARLIMRALGNRDVVIDLEHLSLDKSATHFDPDARGHARLQARADGLWAVNVKWTADGDSRIRNRKQRGISPVFFSRKSDGVIVALHNLALTAQPATHDGVILIAASIGDGMAMLRKLLGLPPDASDGDVLAALGLDSSASAGDAVAAIEKALEAAGASDGNSDAPAADDTAAAADDAPAMDEKKTPATDEKKTAASTKLRLAPAKAVIAPATDVNARLEALEKADESRERDLLIASRDFRPAEKKLLLTADIATVREYVAAAPKAAKQPAARDGGANDVNVSSAAIDAVARATGLTKSQVADAAKKGA